MAGITATMTPAKLEEFFSSRGRVVASAMFYKPLQACAVAVKADVRENFDQSHDPDGNPWPGLKFPRVRGGTKPLMDRGILAASFSGSGQGHIEDVQPFQLTVGTNLDYASIHQTGGTIKPVRGKYLAIPMSKEALRAGWPRDWTGPTLILYGSSLVEFATKGKGKKVKPVKITHYILVKQVTIPPRPFAGFSAKVLDIIDDILGRFLEGVLLS